RWTQWEYHPWWLANIPVYGYWLWFAARARHLFFFSNVNPAIPLGGAMGESKWDILQLLPPEVVPAMLLAEPEDEFSVVMDKLELAGLSFPLIAKPDVGERGFLVKKVENPAQLKEHLDRWKVRFILQEFLAHPGEASVLYHLYPGPSGSFGITSVCLKEFLQITGDGQSSIRQLMQQQARSAFQLSRFEQEFPELLDRVPASGERVLLEPIGNHSRGTKFLNGNHLINEHMTRAFETICRQIPGIQYARFDLKTDSWEALQRGEFKVMELNGVLGEPAHIYDPSHGMLRAYRDLWRHWRLLFRLHRAQKKSGQPPTPHGESWQFIRGYFQYKKQLESR
ncbi:MAG: hypothetical protein IT261_02155, partial [Saprospiraceae bacterium]|nr:hypothetical protein [Saprospiraceae bacterium]